MPPDGSARRTHASPFEAPLSRRRLLRDAATGAVGLSALGALAACGDGAGGGGAGGPLSVVYLGTADQQKSWRKLFERFGKRHPDIKLKSTGVAVNNWAAFFDKISTQIGGGVKYDVVQIATEGMQLFADRGLLHPLDELVAKDKSVIDEYLRDVHPNLTKWNKQYGSPDGKTYFLPGDFNTMCCWYNKEVLSKAGVDEPTDDWTWDDFLAIGRQVKARTGAFLYHAAPEYFVGVMPWLLTNGASTLAPDWKTATANTPQAVEAAEFNRQLVKDKLSPAPGGSFDPYTLAVQGKLAMFGGGRWPIINIRGLNAVDKFGIVAWPHRGAKRGSPVGWNTYPIFKGSARKEHAWTFIKFLISKEGAGYFAKVGGTIVPARRSLASSRDYLGNSPAGTEKLFAALDYATPIPAPPKGNLIQKGIEDAWGLILNGDAEPAAGMQKMQQNIEKNL